MKRKLKSPIGVLGFSLIELMVVVAIIGILAAVAIPNYRRFEEQARATEGKTMLSALYDAEKSAFASYEGYTTNFALAGFTPEGMALRSNVGFGATSVEPLSTANGEINAGALASARAHCASGGCYDTMKFCANYNGAAGATSGCAMDNSYKPASTVPGSPSMSDNSGNETFLAGADTNCGSTTDDQWTVNQSKQWTQLKDCAQ